MKKYITVLTLVLLVLFTNAQVVRPVNNPILNGALINAKEVGDPTSNTNYLVNSDGKEDPAFLNKFNNSANPIFFIGYQIADLLPAIQYNDTILLNQVGKIKLIDTRFDQTKVGYFPVENSLKRKGIKTVGIQIKESPLKWFSKNIAEKYIITDSSSTRQIILVFNQFWFSNYATDYYKLPNATLKTALEYSIDAYTFDGSSYYPQKKVSGVITSNYNKGKAYNTLIDSLLQILRNSVFNNQYVAKETEKNKILPADFNDYYNQKRKKVSETIDAPKGIYKTYQAFLDKTVYADTIEIIKKFDNAGRSIVYACELTALKNGQLESCNNLWGYYDGRNLYFNSGNGFFIKLTRSGNQLIFLNLNNLSEDRIKANMLSTIQIGQSPYEIIKEYSRLTPLTFQLDYNSGILH